MNKNLFRNTCIQLRAYNILFVTPRTQYKAFCWNGTVLPVPDQKMQRKHTSSAFRRRVLSCQQSTCESYHEYGTTSCFIGC